MGIVYRGRDDTLERDVALKVMSAASLGDADSRARFLREAKASARLHHPNIITIYELGEHAGHPFMALELLEGFDLQRAIEAGIRPDPKLTLPIVLQLLAGLGHAHEQGIVHRDVKPSNIFLPQGRPLKIMDFGVARVAGGMTTKGLVVGTPSYMSPEQVRGDKVDGRSDLFSAGLILYELVTGEKAFKAETVAAILYKIAHEEVSLATIPGEPQWSGVRQVLGRSLAHNADERYPDTASMIQDLSRALIDLGGSPGWTSPPDIAALVPLAAHLKRDGDGTATPDGDDVGDVPTTEVTDSGRLSASTRLERSTTRWRSPLALGLMAAGVVVGGLLLALVLARGTALPTASPPVLSVPTPLPVPTAEPSPVVAPSASPAGPSEEEAPREGPAVTTPPASLPATPAATPIATPTPAAVATPPAPTPAATAAPTPSRQLAPDERAELADSLLGQGQYRRALDEARAVLRARPRHALAQEVAQEAEASIVVEECLARAARALDAGDVDEAIAQLRIGLAARPNDARLMKLWRQATQ